MALAQSTSSFASKTRAELPQLAAEEIIASRSGDVLIKNTVLKADHFPSCHNTKLVPILEGAPNFRQVEGLPVMGVAVPTVTGLRTVLNHLGARKGQRKVYWQNLREEPLVFINGQPFVVREADQPFSNLEYTGIDRTRVEDMEARLKQDIMAEAAHFGNQILVMHENEDLTLYNHWEPVTPLDVQTPNEVFAELVADGYDVDYVRIPVTDEKAPKDSDFEALIQRLWAVPHDTAIIFNCQMGRGRTTTGTVIGSLLLLRRMEAFPRKKRTVLASAKAAAQAPNWFAQALSAKRPPAMDTHQDKLKSGMYDVVRSLLRALEQGPDAKLVLDCVIDACSAMQNLREAIASYRTRFLKEVRERQRNVLLNVCLEYLERYYMLIAFTGYLGSSQFDPHTPRHVPFPEWMAQRPELRSILMRLLRRNSMAALELHAASSTGGAPQAGLALDLEGGSQGGASQENAPEKDVIATRSGAVLGAFTILKEDNFPGMRSSKVAQLIEGAPNFRQLPALPVFGVGMPTVEGITSVLKMVSGSTSPNASKHVHALWINMREEPMLYINGKPFVLREEVRPLKNMMEYQGIDAQRLEAMEVRMKKDVLAEAMRHGGRILVAHESFEHGRYGELYDTWEEIDHPDAVLTPREAYESLTSEGFAVQYRRVPVTDGTAPTLQDIDIIIELVQEFGLENPVIFNCQMGIGRTTTGMVIAGLVHMYSGGLDETMVAMRELSSMTMGGMSLPQMDGRQLSGYIDCQMSPRSDNEQDEYRDEEDEVEPKIWDLEPEEVEEQRTLAAGGYVGVRRVVRLLEDGDNAKKTLDAVIDAAADLINLRVSIMKYRKPRSSYKYMRPELQQRNAAFKRGSAYCERYCLLIVLTYYLENVGADSGAPFSQWVQSRPDLQLALTSIQQNPAQALATLPIHVQELYQPTEGSAEVGLEEQRRVLGKRRGRTLTKRTILKSYMVRDPQPLFREAPDLRKAEDLPIYSLGNTPLPGVRALLTHLGAGEGGDVHVVVHDIREELVAYVNGTPYSRRELEMPAAALHHAGIRAQQLEELEVLLKEDILDESAKWGGRVLLHAEDAAKATGPKGEEDIAGLVDMHPGTEVKPFWEPVSMEDEAALQTPLDVMQRLAQEGFSVSYARIPLSRERTPEGADLDVLHQQLLERPPGQEVVHLILSRTATGSSARFMAVALGSFYSLPPHAPAYPRSSSAGGAAGLSSPAAAAVGSRHSGEGLLGTSPPRSSPIALMAADPNRRVSMQMDAMAGEYRGIMALCRLLPGGLESKLAVDKVIAQCQPLGNLLADIRKCKTLAEAAPTDGKAGAAVSAEGAVAAFDAQFAARQLGIHYLKRYFLCITYRNFLDQGGARRPGFDAWFDEQRELHHLASTLNLEATPPPANAFTSEPKLPTAVPGAPATPVPGSK